MTNHDHSYKLLFSHPEMVADLIRGFVHEDWVEQVDFDTLEKVSGSFVTDNLLGREDDLIWRVRWRDQWLYVYLLLEFQSTVDRFMAVRLMTYIGLLYQELIRGDQLTERGRLPPVLPLVLYNGTRRWKVAQHMSSLVEPAPGGLERYRPELYYLLLDEDSLEEHEMPVGCDLMVASENMSLEDAFTLWIKRSLLPRRLPGITIPDFRKLQELSDVIADHEIDWSGSWREQGRAEGRTEGREEGRAEGLAEGRAEGERNLLRRQLARRFGPLDAHAKRRLAEADLATLEIWAERILDAPSLKDVLDP